MHRRRLASDPGILHVMDKHGFDVGLLAEMPPEGLVGVDPVCVLGYNTNRGQSIHLRLRTDDLQVRGVGAGFVCGSGVGVGVGVWVVWCGASGALSPGEVVVCQWGARHPSAQGCALVACWRA